MCGCISVVVSLLDVSVDVVVVSIVVSLHDVSVEVVSLHDDSVYLWLRFCRFATLCS